MKNPIRFLLLITFDFSQKALLLINQGNYVECFFLGTRVGSEISPIHPFTYSDFGEYIPSSIWLTPLHRFDTKYPKTTLFNLYYHLLPSKLTIRKILIIILSSHHRNSSSHFRARKFSLDFGGKQKCSMRKLNGQHRRYQMESFPSSCKVVIKYIRILSWERYFLY